jgi:pimeloyl-ACP methyl ester carboxylesterase
MAQRNVLVQPRDCDVRFEHVRSGPYTIRVAVQGTGPLVVMLHGWPESWYSWRHQMGPISEAGYTAAALDLRGYGGSSRPHATQTYDMRAMIADVQAVADRLGGGKAILIGHDWGAPIAWNANLVDPERFKAVAALAIPYVGQGKEPLIELARRVYTQDGRFFYQVYIEQEGVAEAEVEADVRSSLRKIYYALSGDAPPGAWPTDKRHGDTLLHRLVDPEVFPSWLTDADLDYLVEEFEASGFRGAFNRYRNFHRDFAFLSRFGQQQIEQPALFISGDTDAGLNQFGPEVEARMRAYVPNLRGYHMLEGCGHWTQQERPAEVNRLLLDWLAGL